MFESLCLKKKKKHDSLEHQQPRQMVPRADETGPILLTACLTGNRLAGHSVGEGGGVGGPPYLLNMNHSDYVSVERRHVSPARRETNVLAFHKNCSLDLH